MRKHSMVLLAMVVAAACTNDTRSSTSMLDDPRWRALVAEMSLPEYKEKRLEMYVRTLDGSRAILTHANGQTRATALPSLDRDIGRALPLLVPARFTEKVHAFLHDALEES